MLAALGNLLPLAPLDGFMLAVITVEAVRGLVRPGCDPISPTVYRKAVVLSSTPLALLGLIAYLGDITQALI